MQHFKNKKIKRGLMKSGFTVIESLVAISILLLAVSGSFAAAQSSLQSSNFVKNRVTAYYLAQEGVEYIRHLRDNNGLKMINGDTTVTWLEGVVSVNVVPCAVTSSNVGCRVDTTTGAVPSACSTICPNLRLNKITGQFQYTTSGDNIDSGFNRVIKVEAVSHGADNNTSNPKTEVKVTSKVTWIQAGVTKTLEVSENIYNWQQQKNIL